MWEQVAISFLGGAVLYLVYSFATRVTNKDPP
jgi:hypothetical protein